MPHVDTVLLVISALFIVSILASKASTRLGVPSLLLFIGIGMLAGSDGPGGIYFDHPWVTQLIGVTALAMILFAAGFETRIEDVRPVLAPSLSLATVGVIVSTALVGAFISWVWHVPLVRGLLVGAIISSTDAAAVIAVLRSKHLKLRSHLQEILEAESGCNDPMAVLLMLVLLQLTTDSGVGGWAGSAMLAKQLAIGAALGLAAGPLGVWAINRLRLEWEGLYPVLCVTIAIFAYSVTTSLGGSGFLAVYIAGVIIGNKKLLHRTTLRVFNNGIAWLMQIAMFLVLGLQVFPSKLPSVALTSFLVAAFLIFVARPISVFVAIPVGPLNYKDKLFISWAGLRGAVPVVLATFPLLARVSDAERIFHVVFFVALTSLLIQGTTLSTAARLLKLDLPSTPRPVFPIQFNPTELTDSELAEFKIAPGAQADGKRIMDLGLPKGSLVVIVGRGNQFVAAEGGTILHAGDVTSILTTKDNREILRTILESAHTS